MNICWEMTYLRTEQGCYSSEACNVECQFFCQGWTRQFLADRMRSLTCIIKEKKFSDAHFQLKYTQKYFIRVKELSSLYSSCLAEVKEIKLLRRIISSFLQTYLLVGLYFLYISSRHFLLLLHFWLLVNIFICIFVEKFTKIAIKEIS
jgi:hypothetical protein